MFKLLLLYIPQINLCNEYKNILNYNFIDYHKKISNSLNIIFYIFYKFYEPALSVTMKTKKA